MNQNISTCFVRGKQPQHDTMDKKRKRLCIEDSDDDDGDEGDYSHRADRDKKCAKATNPYVKNGQQKKESTTTEQVVIDAGLQHDEHNEEVLVSKEENDSTKCPTDKVMVTEKEREEVIASLEFNFDHIFDHQNKEKYRNDEEIMIAAIEINARILNYMPNGTLRVINDDYMEILKHASERLRNDKKFILKLFNRGHKGILKHVSEKIRHDTDFAIQLLNNGHTEVFDYASECVFNEKECILKVLESKDGPHLARKIIRRGTLSADKDVVLKAILWDSLIIFDVSPELLQDPDVISCYDEISDDMVDHVDLYKLPDHWKYSKKIWEAIYKDELEWCGQIHRYNRDDLAMYDLLCEIFDRDCLAEPSERISAVVRMRDSPPSEFANLETKFRDDMEVVDVAWKKNPRILAHASTRVQTAFRMREDATDFHRMSLDLKNDKDIALEAVVKAPHIMSTLSSDLRKDRTFLLKAIERQPLVFKGIDQSLRFQRYFAWQAVQKNVDVYGQLEESFQTDPVICVAVFGKDDPKLGGCPTSVLNNSDDVYEIVIRCPLAIQHIAERFKADHKIALAAVSRNVNSMEFIADSLKNDRGFMFKVLMLKPSALKYATSEVRYDRDFLLNVINESRSGEVIRYVEDGIWSDRDFVLNVAAKCPLILSDKARKFRHDREIFLEALKGNEETIRHATYTMRSDREFVLKILSISEKSWKRLPREYQNDFEFVLAATKQNFFSLDYAGPALLRNGHFMAEILQASIKGASISRRWEYADESLKHAFRSAKRIIKRDAQMEMNDYLRKAHGGLVDTDAEEDMIRHDIPFDGTTLHDKVNKMQAVIYETLWLQRQVLASIPGDTADHIQTFVGRKEKQIRKKCKQANNLKRCIPVFIALQNRGKDWSFVETL